MKPIGGYFELELPTNADYMHSGCLHLNSGRHALEYILCNLEKLPMAIWLPYYTCEVVLQPIVRLGIKVKFYQIDENLELLEPPRLTDDELIIVNNYFGIKDEYVLSLAALYKNKIIIDCAQAFYFQEFLGLKAFYSPRKFFGLPDGGLAIFPGEERISLEIDKSYDRCSSLLMRLDDEVSTGYVEFRRSSEEISKMPMKRMSSLTRKILSSIDFDSIRIARKSNYDILRNVLQNHNLLSTPASHKVGCPMVYPFLVLDDKLRQRLIDNKIFVAQYWPNVLRACNENSVEYNMAKYLLPLPIDQRYDEMDMRRIISIITDGGNN